ncbi:MAG: protease inhibitor I42 family protein [Candidatus Omnitrophota bacterium]
MKIKQLAGVLILAAVVICGIILIAIRISLGPCKVDIITVYSGKEFEIKLDSNGTTGYLWQLATPIDAAMINLKQSEYIAPNTNLVGAPGIEKWTFIALKPGKARVSLKYVRPWEKGIAPVNKKEFKVIIR